MRNLDCSGIGVMADVGMQLFEDLESGIRYFSDKELLKDLFDVVKDCKKVLTKKDIYLGLAPYYKIFPLGLHLSEKNILERKRNRKAAYQTGRILKKTYFHKKLSEKEIRTAKNFFELLDEKCTRLDYLSDMKS
jgi:hypothetical protein